MKVATIGGGSTYTPELVQGFLDRHERLSHGGRGASHTHFQKRYSRRPDTVGFDLTGQDR